MNVCVSRRVERERKRDMKGETKRGDERERERERRRERDKEREREREKDVFFFECVCVSHRVGGFFGILKIWGLIPQMRKRKMESVCTLIGLIWRRVQRC